ncbi:hypothetical protein ES332_D08G108900v1 [Gossypium tomentosum]|uniref:Uncharacterized protein n=1 Tax=Gossypium tomentosum TaxID=34277 RepID=A0A5D2JSN5_GOSTO|nr:hypothetical protein ES332_D08G108900v1 [Gossypium tomentosum]
MNLNLKRSRIRTPLTGGHRFAIVLFIAGKWVVLAVRKHPTRKSFFSFCGSQFLLQEKDLHRPQISKGKVTLKKQIMKNLKTLASGGRQRRARVADL